jgi:glutamate-1-semialdehyde 2,1-aminomutase
LANDGEGYGHVTSLGVQIQKGLEGILQEMCVKAVVARQGSAFCIYFMDHCPRDWHDLASNHDFSRDERMRRTLIERGIYFFPLATKQCSISFAHSSSDIEMTLQEIRSALRLTSRG